MILLIYREWRVYMNNYYRTLGISSAATPSEIKKAYRDLSKKYHPDVNLNNKDAERMFQEVNEAYAVLNNPKKREEYDLTLKDDLKKTSLQRDTRFSYDGWNDMFAKDRLDYITFLEQNEKMANQCGRSLKALKEEAYTLPGLIIYEKHQQIKKELIQLERDCLAFDGYMKYLEISEKRANLCSRSLREIKSQFMDKRGVISESDLDAYRRKVAGMVYGFERERKNKIEVLKNELQKKDLPFDMYLEERGLSEDTISTNAITTAIQSMELVDIINLQLMSFGIDLNQFLVAKEKTLIEMRYKELVKIEDAITELMNDSKKQSIDAIFEINLNEVKEGKKSTK